MQEKVYWLAFSQCNGIGPSKFRQLLDYFRTAESAWNAAESELIQSGIGKAAATKILDFKKEFSFDWQLERLEKLNVDFLTLSEEGYPQLLKQIERPPFVLYIKGNKQLLQSSEEGSQNIAVVGTRKITEYGRQITETLTEELASAGFTIVSGLALGVDAVAHTAALAANGKTIAVLGSGVDYCTPRENLSLYNKIVEQGGAIVSEVPLGYTPLKGSFPSRNRIIAGLCVGVLVTEGAEDSGSLITAKDAFASGRKVFAVPGPITSSVSRGPIALITKGAKVVIRVSDIIDELGILAYERRRNKTIKGDSKGEQMIIDLLLDQNLHFDELVKRTGSDSAHVGTLLSLMEIKGIVQQFPGGFFGISS